MASIHAARHKKQIKTQAKLSLYLEKKPALLKIPPKNCNLSQLVQASARYLQSARLQYLVVTPTSKKAFKTDTYTTEGAYVI